MTMVVSTVRTVCAQRLDAGRSGQWALLGALESLGGCGDLEQMVSLTWMLKSWNYNPKALVRSLESSHTQSCACPAENCLTAFGHIGRHWQLNERNGGRKLFITLHLDVVPSCPSNAIETMQNKKT
eukprot:4763433-Amphidinium_carterae.1